MDKIKILSKLTGLKEEYQKASRQADIVRKNSELKDEAKNTRIAKIQEEYKTLYLDKLQSAINEANKQLSEIVNNYLNSIPKIPIEEKNYITNYYTGIIKPCGIAKEINWLHSNMRSGDIYIEIITDSIERLEKTGTGYMAEPLSYDTVSNLEDLKKEVDGKNIQGKEELEAFIQGTLNFLYSAGIKGNFCSSIEEGTIQFDVAI